MITNYSSNAYRKTLHIFICYCKGGHYAKALVKSLVWSGFNVHIFLKTKINIRIPRDSDS